MKKRKGCGQPAKKRSRLRNCQPHSPRESNVSSTARTSPGDKGAASYESDVHPQLRTTEAKTTGCEVRFSNHSRDTAASPERSRPKRTVSRPPQRSSESVNTTTLPPGATDTGRREVQAPASKRHEKRIPRRRIRSQSRPRPDFLIFPSSVSDSTILSSTPLMKVLLPGVE